MTKYTLEHPALHISTRNCCSLLNRCVYFCHISPFPRYVVMEWFMMHSPVMTVVGGATFQLAPPLTMSVVVGGSTGGERITSAVEAGECE